MTTGIPLVASTPRVGSLPVRGVRKATAAAMVQSAFTSPHVSMWMDADATPTVELVARLRRSTEFADVEVSPLLVMARAVLWAAARTPMINSVWVESEGGASIEVRHHVNLGITVATPRGLLVPTITNAHELGMRELAVALQEARHAARSGRATVDHQHGGTITITNLGASGADVGTPIITPGQAAIVAMGSIRQKPWVVDGEVRPRWVTTVAGSFDHRVVDGDAISRFLNDVAAVLAQPAIACG